LSYVHATKNKFVLINYIRFYKCHWYMVAANKTMDY